MDAKRLTSARFLPGILFVVAAFLFLVANRAVYHGYFFEVTSQT